MQKLYTLMWLRELFHDTIRDYVKRALESYERLQNDSWELPKLEIQLDKPPSLLDIAKDFGDPEFRFLHLVPELICRLWRWSRHSSTPEGSQS